MKNLEFTISQCHIDNGKKRDPWSCPTALALRDSEYEDAYVNLTYIHVKDNQGKWEVYEVNDKLRKWIWNYDRKGIPGTNPDFFELNKSLIYERIS